MIIKPIVTRKTIMHRLFGERFAPRLRLGLCDFERRMLEEKRRLRNCGLALAIGSFLFALLIDFTR